LILGIAKKTDFKGQHVDLPEYPI